MKKLFTLLLLSNLLTLGLKAQLVLTKADFEPVAGDIQAVPRFDSINVLPRNTGMNQTWDFSAVVLKNVPYGIRTYTPVLSVPASSLFSNATLAAQVGPNQYEFYRSVTSPTPRFELVGNSFPGRVDSLKDTRIDDTWPIAYGNTSTDTYSGTMTVPPVTEQVSGTVTTVAAGSGTLILPGGFQLDNALQVVSTRYSMETNSTSAPPILNFTVVTYNYYHAISKFPVIMIEDWKSNLSAVVADYSHVYYNKPLTLDILESQSEFAFAMYPNPAAKNFSISLGNPKKEKCMVQVYDPAGKMVSGKDMGNASEIKENISVSNFSAGVYFVKIQSGNKAAFKKLVVE